MGFLKRLDMIILSSIAFFRFMRDNWADKSTETLPHWKPGSLKCQHKTRRFFLGQRWLFPCGGHLCGVRIRIPAGSIEFIQDLGPNQYGGLPLQNLNEEKNTMQILRNYEYQVLSCTVRQRRSGWLPGGRAVGFQCFGAIPARSWSIIRDALKIHFYSKLVQF